MIFIIPNLQKQINKFIILPSWKLIRQIKLAINEDSFKNMNLNPNAIKIFKNKPSKINFRLLSCNPNAIKILIREIKLHGDSAIKFSSLIQNRNVDKIFKNKSIINLIPPHIKFNARCRWSAIKLNQTNNQNEIDWNCISNNPNAISMIINEINLAKFENRKPKINWHYLSGNPNAIRIIINEINLAKLENRNSEVNWNFLSGNTGAIELINNEIMINRCINLPAKLENRKPEIEWFTLSGNPNAYDLINNEIISAKMENRESKINWSYLSGNPSTINLIINEINSAESESRKSKIDWKVLPRNPSIFRINKQLYKKIVLKLYNLISF